MPAVVNANQFDAPFDGALGGYRIHGTFPGNGFIKDLNTGARTYLGDDSSALHTGGNIPGSVYIEDGTNTGDGSPSWRYDDGSKGGHLTSAIRE